MLVKDFITKEIPVLKCSDTGKYALALMDDFKIRHLPLINEGLGTYRAIVSEKELLAASDLSCKLDDILYLQTETWSIREDALFMDAIAMMARHELSLLPVVANNDEYVGAITEDDAFHALTDYAQAETSGSVILLKVQPVDYSMSDIARIVESNHAQVLSLLTTPADEKGNLNVMLKINREDASAVIRSFERFNYLVTGYSSKNGVIDETFQQRINEFIHYINI